MARRPVVIAYDISSNRRRRRVRRLLHRWRLDGQKSVHECLLSLREAEELYLQIMELIDPKTDRLLLAWLHPHGPVLARGVGRAGSLFTKMIQVS